MLDPQIKKEVCLRRCVGVENLTLLSEGGIESAVHSRREFNADQKVHDHLPGSSEHLSGGVQLS